MTNDDHTRLERPDIYVVARILERLARAGPGHPRTRLQHAARLNTRVFERYMAWLTAKGYVEIAAEGAVTYSITSKGIEALRLLSRWIEDAIGNDRG